MPTTSTGHTFSRWALLAAVVAVTAAVHLYGIGTWPWGTDELPSMLELGLLDPSIQPADHSPQSFTVRITRLMPVWYGAQWAVLQVVPPTELGSRLLPAACGMATAVAWYLYGLRRRGLLFALAMVLFIDGSAFFVSLSQANRYYTMAVLLLSFAWICVESGRGPVAGPLWAAAWALLAVLSHNLLVVVFCLGFGCVLVAWLLGWVDRAMLIRSAATAGISAASYLLYLRPIMGSWSGYGFAGTNVLVSFVAHVGVPTLALAALGAVIGLAAPAERKAMGWWAGLALGSVLVVAASPRIIPAWNVRYGILFTVPLWVTAALAFEYVAKRMASHWTVIGWYGLIALLLLPKLASQYRDGSTHDFRTAAAMVVADRPGDRVILTNLDFPTKYYLPKHLRRQVRSWQPGDELPAGPGYLLEGTNLWQPVPRFPGRRRVLLGQVARRRFDEQSYVVRVYRFGPKGSPDAD